MSEAIAQTTSLSPDADGEDIESGVTMRLLWVNHRDPMHPEAGGAESHIWELMKRMPSTRFRHTLLCEAVPGLPKEEIRDGIRIVRRGSRLTLHAAALLWDEPSEVSIECIAHAVPYFRVRLSRGTTIIMLFHIHQSILKSEVGGPMSLLIRLLEKTLRFRRGPFVTGSEATKEAARKELRITAPITVIPPGVDVNRFVPGPKYSPPTFLYLGMLKRYKRVDHIIEAFKAVGQDTRLWIAGEGYDGNRLRAIAGSRADIRFLGRVEEGTKALLLRGATANVLASSVEGYGLTVLEAAASGTPTVSYDVGPAREAIVDGATGALATNGSINDLTRAMIAALRHPEWGSRAHEIALNRTWDDAARRFSAYVMQTATDHGSPRS